MARIRFSPTATVTRTGVGVILRSDLGTFQLDGADVHVFVDAIVPLLDGTRDKEEIARALSAYAPGSVTAFLDALLRHGLAEIVGPEPSARWRAEEAFLQKWTERPEISLRRMRDARVLVVGLEPWGMVAAAELAASGIGTLHLLDDGRVTDEDLLSTRFLQPRHLGRARRDAAGETLAQAAPWCRVTSDPLPTDNARGFEPGAGRWDLVLGTLAADELRLLHGLARFAHQANVCSLYGCLEGLDAVVGPVVVPGKTACWNCARLRRLANVEHQELEHALQASLLCQRPGYRRPTYLAPMAPLLGHLLALEALKILSRYTHSHLTGRLLVQSLVSLEATLHTVMRMPWCDTCGGAASGTDRHGWGSGSDGGDLEGRATRPLDLRQEPDDRQLRAMLAGLVDSKTGIIDHLAVSTPDATEPELPITSFARLARYTDGTYVAGERKTGSGKGLTAAEAMVGAIGEAIERYSASRYRPEDLHRAPLLDQTAAALDPRTLCLYDEAQYARLGFPFARFDTRQPIDWLRGQWLDTGEPVWLPALLTFFNFRVEKPERFCQATSNGLAAGDGLEDATLRAVLELVERDAFMITWRGRRPCRRLIGEDALEPGTREAVRQLQEQGVHLEMFLIDAGLGIPTVMCLGIGDGEAWPAATVALGTHPIPRVAARRAILEQGHVGPYIARLMRERRRFLPATCRDIRTLTDHALYYVPRHRVPAFDFIRRARRPAVSLADLPDDQDASLTACVANLTTAGVRIAVADVTSPDIAEGPFRVVRALGVGMQPIDFGFGLQRLASARLARSQSKRQRLNPHPHPFA